MSIRDLRLAWLQWRIRRTNGVRPSRSQDSAGSTYITYIARPVEESKQPPVWEYEQLLRGLTSRIEAPDLAELERRIGEQDRLRWVMYRDGERPFYGRTYIEMEQMRAGIFLG